MDLKTKRKKLGLSQEAVAKMLGVHITTYGNWELGKTEPDIENLLKLSEILRVSIDDLLDKPTKLINLLSLNERQQKIIGKTLIMDERQQELTLFYIDTLMNSV